MTNKLISLVLLTFFLASINVYASEQFLFPKKKPSVFKKIEIITKSNNLNNLPQKKPIIITEDKKVIVEPKKIEKKNIQTKNSEIKQEKKLKISQKWNVFLLPQKKPITYKLKSKEIVKSSILNQKDFERAKETIKFIKARKWNSAIKSSKKVKDSDFRTLITWMHLKTTQNSATFSDYKNFIFQFAKI